MKFIDLFAGIGGFHLVLHRLGAECVFASELDKFARATYEANFKEISPILFENNNFNKDILSIKDYTILPDFNLLCADFPCQPFSQIGKKLGFKDTTNNRGNMFFTICDIIQAKKPEAFFLENVRGLLWNDNGKTFEIIKHNLTNVLGYKLHYKVIKATEHGLPQFRPRVYMVGFREDVGRVLPDFSFPKPIPLKLKLSDIVGGKCNKDIAYTILTTKKSSNFFKNENYFLYTINGEIRHLTNEEDKKLMGLPDDFIIMGSNTQIRKQLGNSVAIPVVQAIAINIVKYLEDNYNIKVKHT